MVVERIKNEMILLVDFSNFVETYNFASKFIKITFDFNIIQIIKYAS